MVRKRHIEPPAPLPAPAPANEQTEQVGRCFTIGELAQRWRASRYTISESIKRGDLRAFRIGNRNWRIAEAEVLRYEQVRQAS